MTQQANVRIDIASQFTGRKAFKDAELATGSLDKAVTALGKKMAGAFSAYKIAQFGKDSVKAFMDDQKAAASLANQLKNVNLALSTGDVEKFIAKMQDQTGILDDELRPAYAQLVRVMGSTTETQKALATAFDVSSGTGADFQQVVDALSQAFVGNTKGLKALNVGLTQNELKTKSYGQIVDILNKKFAGAGAAAVDTYAGKMKLLNVAVENAKETIGQGFVDAFTTIANDGDFKTVTGDIEHMATYVADTIRGLGSLMDTLNSKTPEWLKRIGGSQTVQNIAIGPLKRISDYLVAQQRKKDIQNSLPSGIQNFLDEQKLKPKKVEQAKAEAAAVARAKQLKAAIDAQNKAQAELVKKKKEAAALDALALKYKQASAIFDMEKIELAAAAMSKQSNEDYARIKLKQDLITLNEAIQSGDLAAAQAAAKVVEEDYKRVQAYQAINIAAGIQSGLIKNVANAASLIPTDLKLIDLDNLNAALAAIQALIDALNKVPKVGGTGVTGGSTGGGLPSLINPDGSLTPRGKVTIPSLEDSPMEKFIASVSDAVSVLNKNTTALDPLIKSGFFDLAFNAAEFSGANINPYALTDAQGKAYSQGQSATITIIDNTSGLIEVVTDATQQASANGINTRLIRNSGGLNW